MSNKGNVYCLAELTYGAFSSLGQVDIEYPPGLFRTHFNCHLSLPQRYSIIFWAFVSVILFLSAPFLFLLDTAWWLLLIPASVIVWRANRASGEQFILQRMIRDPAVYEHISTSHHALSIRVIARNSA